MKILAESTLTSKEQLTVPKVVRRLLDLHVGDTVVWSLNAEGRWWFPSGVQTRWKTFGQLLPQRKKLGAKQRNMRV